MNECDKLINDFLDELFTNGMGVEVADRLLLVQGDGPTHGERLGGWCREAIRSRLAALVDKVAPRWRGIDEPPCAGERILVVNGDSACLFTVARSTVFEKGDRWMPASGLAALAGKGTVAP